MLSPLRQLGLQPRRGNPARRPSLSSFISALDPSYPISILIYSPEWRLRQIWPHNRRNIDCADRCGTPQCAGECFRLCACATVGVRAYNDQHIPIRLLSRDLRKRENTSNQRVLVLTFHFEAKEASPSTEGFPRDRRKHL